ncbi:hypothetical protein HDU84_000967 [Entophlyctis sp. JEL0112]|nr:hypothetical protein HDU84_000967 [Entophlyctis sp. JEL0112]
MLMCHVKGCVADNFPLDVQDAEVESVQVEFNEPFMRRLMNKIEWDALVKTSFALGIDQLPAQVPDMIDEDFLKRIHRVVLEVTLHFQFVFIPIMPIPRTQTQVTAGKMVCRGCGHVYPISDGIPNMLLQETEHDRNIRSASTGYTALIPGSISGQVVDVASFDTYMSLSFDLNNDSGSFGSSMRSTSVYNCPDWDGTGGASSSSMAAMVASSSAAAAAVAASSSSSSSGSVSIPVIAGAAGGVAALLIIVAVIFCCVRRKKRQNESMPEKDFSTAYGMNNMSNDKQPFSSQGAGMGYGNPPVNSMAPSREPQMCEAVYDYTANLPDELTAIVGDKVIVKIEYDDGWGFGYNTRTRKEGTFPLDILDKFQSGDQGYNDGNRTTRASSMYGPGGNTNNKNNNGANSYYDTNNGTESVYYAQSEYNTNSVYAPAGGGSTVHEAAYDFTPEQPDEIELRVGDRVELKQQYDDGWALGRNLAINKEGLFPLDCLAGFDGPQQFDAQGNKKHNNRVSSMYGTESQYGPQSMYGGNSSYYEGGTQSYYGTGNGQDSVYYGQ